MAFGIYMFIGATLLVNVLAEDLDKCSSGDQFKHENSCEVYYTCNKGVKELSYCTEGKYYNPKVKQCGPLVDVADICYTDIIRQIEKLKIAADKLKISKRKSRSRARRKPKATRKTTSTEPATTVAEKKRSFTKPPTSTTGKIRSLNQKTLPNPKRKWKTQKASIKNAKPDISFVSDTDWEFYELYNNEN